MKKTPQELLTELLDREAIRELPARYCDCVWRGDVEAMVQLFTEDGALVIATVEGETRVQGRAALRDFLAGALKYQQRPYVHNIVIDLKSEGRASGRSYLDLRSARHNMELMGAGHYADDYRKVRGKWLFESRTFMALRIDEGPGSLKPRAAAASAARRVRRAH